MVKMYCVYKKKKASPHVLFFFAVNSCNFFLKKSRSAHKSY